MNAISPTTEEPTPPAEDIPQAIAPSAEACQLYQDLTARGIQFVLAGELVKMLRSSEDVALPNAEEHAQLRRLKPEIVELIAQSQRPAISAGRPGSARRRPAPPFQKPHRIRVLLGLLGPGAGEAACVEVADALVAECRDQDLALSRRTYLGIARDVCRGRISQAAVQSAFEIASGPSIYHRGRAFIAEVSRCRRRTHEEAAYHRRRKPAH